MNPIRALKRWLSFYSQGLIGKSRLPHGRCWWNLFCVHWCLEWHLWSKSFRLGADVGGWDDYSFTLAIALPPVSFHLSGALPHGSWLQRCLPDKERTTCVYWFERALWIQVWALDDWCRTDPWWNRITFHFDDILLGRAKCTTDVIHERRIVIQLDGREYHGTAKFERWRWKRPRWFAKVRDSTWIDMDQGLPHAGKGECGYDCGDDALCGWGINGFDVDEAIADGVRRVSKYRQRYGMPSTVAV